MIIMDNEGIRWMVKDDQADEEVAERKRHCHHSDIDRSSWPCLLNRSFLTLIDERKKEFYSIETTTYDTVSNEDVSSLDRRC